VYLFTCPLNSENTNLTKHGIFVPTLLNIALTRSQSDVLYYTIGETNTISVSQSESSLPYKLQQKNIEIIPAIRQDKILTNSITQPGNYNLTQNDNQLKSIAFNYSRKESSNRFLTIDEIKEVQPNFKVFENNDIANQIEKLSKGTQLWKFCIILCLLFLLCEILLIRFYNRN
jgi:hypothetical protein